MITFSLFSVIPSPLLRRGHCNPQHKIHHHRRKQRHSQHRRPKPIIKAPLAPHPYTLRPPMERHERVQHRRQRDEGEEAGADLSNAVAEVEQADG